MTVTANRKRPRIKLLRTRLLLDDARSLGRGWLFRIATRKEALPDPESAGLAILSESSLTIKWREELKEINHGRIHNMGLSCELVNGVRLKPGEVFSLRRFLGAATEKMGFREGPMFFGGRIEYVAGGGACLISTLLFNAALKANLDILEKHNHSTDLWGEDRFIGLGLDATYVFGRKDLKFRNTHGSDVFVAAELSRDDLALRCRLVSVKPLNTLVTLRSEVLEELQPEQEAASGAGTERRPYRKGWVVVTERYASAADRPDRAECTFRSKEVYKPFYL